MSHTGALAGANLVYDAAFRRAGMLRVKELGELFEAVATLSAGIQVKGDPLTVVTNGGGAGVLAADALEEQGGQLTTLSTETLADRRLDFTSNPALSLPVRLRSNRHSTIGLVAEGSLPRRGKTIGQATEIVAIVQVF